jgi:hypothetical protein
VFHCTRYIRLWTNAPNLICFCLLLQYNYTLCIGYKDIRWSGHKT